MKSNTLALVQDAQQANWQIGQNAIHEAMGLRPASRFPEVPGNVAAWEAWHEYEVVVEVDRFVSEFRTWLDAGCPLTGGIDSGD